MLERAIKQGQNPGAMFSLACYLHQNGSENDHRRVYSLLERSLKLYEHEDVINRLGICYFHGHGVTKDLKVAVQLFERAFRVKEEDPFIMANLAYALLHAPGYQHQKGRAISLYREAIRLSSEANLMNSLGLLYHNGTLHLNASRKKAWKWYSRSIDTSRFPSALYNKAVLILENDPNEDDVQQAIRLLEDALDLEKDEYTFLKLADTYLEYDVDLERAVYLYETASIQFNSSKVRSVLIRALVDPTSKLAANYKREFDFCSKHFAKTKNWHSLRTMSEMLWTGAIQIDMDRKKAVEVMKLVQWERHDWPLLILRQDPSFFPGGKRKAERIMKRFNDRIDTTDIQDVESIILSESDCVAKKRLALESFRAQKDRKNSLYAIAWLWPHLRIGVYDLPFQGHLKCVTNVMRMYARWKNVASLNLASVLLEMDGMQQEAVSVLEELMDSEVRLIAMLNLSYILMNDMKGVKRDSARGMKLLQDAVEETNEVSARAMLANALTEQAECSAEDVERARRLWRSVQEEIEDEEELKKVGRLISASNEQIWSAGDSK